MSYTYVKQNDAPIEIEHVFDEHDPEKDFLASFWFDGRRHYLDDYVRTHDNPWIGGDFPDYIHGMEGSVYFGTLFIELIGDDAINVYREVKDTAV